MAVQYPIPHVPMLGKGSVLIDLFGADGLPTGAFDHLGNCTKLELDLKDDLSELYQSINKAPSLIATALKKRQIKLTITGTDFNSDHMALVAMSSGKTTLATTATTVSAEVLAAAGVPKFGKFFRFANFNADFIGTPPVVKSGATTLAAGTDYVLVDSVKSMIYIPAASTQVDADALTVTYHTLVGSQDQVAGAVVPFQQGHILFVPDATDGQNIGLDAWHVNLNPNGQVGLIADDYGNWSLDGNCLDDTANHPLSPYFLETFF